MKQATLVVLMWATCLQGNTCEFEKICISTHQSYHDTTALAGPGIEEMLASIMHVTGLQQNFELKAAKVRNIEASIAKRKRVILYNPVFINDVRRVTPGKWGMLALLAHEVGHHLNGHTIRKSGSRPAVELEADEFAGFVLQRLGAPLAEATTVMQYIAGEKSSSTHPGRVARIAAMEKGWHKAAGL